jgi:DNA-binding GntR family transcriptional regulator
MRRLIIKKTKSIRHRVYDHLRKQILSGEVPPRQHLVETKIAKKIGTSRTPVREALHSLELEGLIESVPRVGYVVRAVSEEEVGEICAIRIAIEGLAVAWAMQKAQEKLVEELRANVSLTEERVSQSGEFRAFIDLDAQFHEIIARHSGSRRLLELAQTLRHHMLRYRMLSVYKAENVLRAISGHKDILSAIEMSDVEEVTKAMRRHLEESKKDILRYAFKEPPKTEG